MHVLDSSAMIDVLNETARGVRVMNKLQNPLVITTAITMHELLRQQSFLKPLFDRIKVLSYDASAAASGAKLENKLNAQGKPLQLADLLIASVCLSHGATLVTTDKDFLRVPGLKIVYVK